MRPRTAPLTALVALLLASVAGASCAEEPTGLEDGGDDAAAAGPTGSGSGGGDGTAGGDSSGAAGGAAITRVDGAPRDAATPASVTLDASGEVLSASVIHGAAAFGTDGGLRVVDGATDALVTLDLFDVESDHVGSPGAVRGLARRPAGGAFVVADAGLLHDASSVLLRSPLDAALDGAAVEAIDVRALDGGAEQLWLVADGAGVLVGAELVGFSLAERAIDRLIGVADGVALAVSDGALFTVDVGAGSASLLADGVGAVSDAARAEDGTVWLATDAGLLRLDPTGGLDRITLAAEGGDPIAMHAVAAAFGAVAAVGDVGLVGVDAEGPFLIDGDARPGPGAVVAVDGAGDVWLGAETSVVRYATGAPVTFANDVAPLLADACSTCHATGVDDAPVLAFDDHDTVVDLAASIADRMTKPSSPMPPTGLLAASETAPVLRWIATGMAP